MANCPICKTSGVEAQNLAGPAGIICPRCGLFTVLNPSRSPFVDSLEYFLERPGADATLRRSRLSHIVRRQQNPRSHVSVPIAQLDSWGLDDSLPSPADQFDNLILWTGDHQANCAVYAIIQSAAIAAWIGAPIDVDPSEALGWILSQNGVDEMIERRMEGLRLTLKGWDRYQALKKSATDSWMAFMAMKFDDEELAAVLEKCFKPAAAAAGFQLRNLAEGQPAGLIDDQIRVGIRRSKFVIADLTHANNGAYWEAGFAEGAGKPVIYTCNKNAWATQRTHFDTNHLATIIWDSEDLTAAGHRLTAMIRATLPTDAKLE